MTACPLPRPPPAGPSPGLSLFKGGRCHSLQDPRPESMPFWRACGHGTAGGGSRHGRPGSRPPWTSSSLAMP